MTPISDLELNCLSIFVTLWPQNPNVSVWHQYWKTQFSGPMRKNKLAPPLFLHCGIKTLTKNTIWVALGLKTKKSSDFDHGTDFRRSPLVRVADFKNSWYLERSVVSLISKYIRAAESYYCNCCDTSVYFLTYLVP